MNEIFTVTVSAFTGVPVMMLGYTSYELAVKAVEDYVKRILVGKRCTRITGRTLTTH